MSRFRCDACDIRLTPDELRIETSFCPPCRAEHTAGCQAERVRMLERLRELVMMEMSRRCAWVYHPQGERQWL